MTDILNLVSRALYDAEIGTHLFTSSTDKPWIHINLTEEQAKEWQERKDKEEICAKQLKELLTDRDAVTREIAHHLEETKSDLKFQSESMDEAIIKYRANMLAFRDSFKKAKDEELEATYSLWEKYDEEIKSLKAKVNESVLALKPLTEILTQVSEGLYRLSRNDAAESFNSIMNMVERYEALPEASKEVFGKFLDTYKGK